MKDTDLFIFVQHKPEQISISAINKFDFEKCYLALDNFYFKGYEYGRGENFVYGQSKNYDKIIDRLLLQVVKIFPKHAAETKTKNSTLFPILDGDLIDLHDCSKGMAYYYLAKKIHELKNNALSYINVCQGKGNHSDSGKSKLSEVLNHLRATTNDRISFYDYIDNKGGINEGCTSIEVQPDPSLNPATATVAVSASTPMQDSPKKKNEKNTPPAVQIPKFDLTDFPSLSQSNSPVKSSLSSKKLDVLKTPNLRNSFEAEDFLDRKGNAPSSPINSKVSKDAHDKFSAENLLDVKGNALDNLALSGTSNSNPTQKNKLNHLAKEFEFKGIFMPLDDEGNAIGKGAVAGNSNQGVESDNQLMKANQNGHKNHGFGFFNQKEGVKYTAPAAVQNKVSNNVKNNISHALKGINPPVA